MDSNHSRDWEARLEITDAAPVRGYGGLTCGRGNGTDRSECI